MTYMGRKVLINQLLLAYSPLSNYDFTAIKSDPVMQEILDRSSLYVIAQRPEIRFDNIVNNEKEKIIEFEIRQKNNPNVIKCKVPLFQKNIATDTFKKVLLHVGSNDKNNDMKATPLNNIHGLKFYQESISPENFLIWFSPEKFLQNYWKKYLIAEVEGNTHDFTKYNVHYVGQATKQDIWKRLTGHETLQDILSLEYPLCYGSLPTHEIAILFFCFQENLQMHTFGDNSSVGEMVNSLMGRNIPEQRTIFLDAEKALIKAMQPKYNEKLFKKYPQSADGLYKHNYDSISYSFTDPITLVYDKGEIQGGLNFLGGDTIIVQGNKTMKLIKHKE